MRAHAVEQHAGGADDDAALVDSSPEMAAQRVTAIAQGSSNDADMTINVGKTEVMHVQAQGKLRQVTSAEAKKQCKHRCSHMGCNR